MSGRDRMRAALVELGRADEAWANEHSAEVNYPRNRATASAASKAHERYQAALLVVLNIARRLWNETKAKEGKP